MWLYVLSQGLIPNSYNTKFLNFQQGKKVFENFKKIKNNLIHAKLPMYYDKQTCKFKKLTLQS